MKWLLVLSVMVTSTSFAISHKDFVKLKREQREEIIKVYKDFISEYSKTIEISSAQKISFPEFIETAYAAEADCLYGGWASKRVNGLCSLPRSNPAFQRESCGQGQMPCQPLLFGRGVCVGAATREQKRSAFANCEKKFESMGRTLANVVEYISDPEVSQDADELFQLVDEICRTGAQASTPMCANLKDRVSEIKNKRQPPVARVATPTRVESRQALTVAAEDAGQITTTVQELNTKTRCESCEAQREATVDEPERRQERVEPQVVEPAPTTAFPRIESGYGYEACSMHRSSSDGYDVRSIGDCRTNERVPAGFTFRPGREHPLMNVQTRYPGGSAPGRFWELATRNNAFNETFLMMEEYGGGPDSHNVKSYMFVIPRVTVPSVRAEGDNLIATLPTGETVTMNKATKQITSGALSEGPIDLSTDRFQRKPPNIQYSGRGISIRLDHRFEHPLTSSATATVKQGSKTCTIPRANLFDAEGKLKTNSDAALLAVLNQGCRGGGFTLP